MKATQEYMFAAASGGKIHDTLPPDPLLQVHKEVQQTGRTNTNILLWMIIAWG